MRRPILLTIHRHSDQTDDSVLPAPHSKLLPPEVNGAFINTMCAAYTLVVASHVSPLGTVGTAVVDYGNSERSPGGLLCWGQGCRGVVVDS